MVVSPEVGCLAGRDSRARLLPMPYSASNQAHPDTIPTIPATRGFPVPDGHQNASRSRPCRHGHAAARDLHEPLAAAAVVPGADRCARRLRLALPARTLASG